MNPGTSDSLSRAALAAACVLALALAGCDRAPKPKADEAPAAAPAAPAAPAGPAPVSAAPAVVPAATTAPAVAAAATRKVPVALQGVASAGLTVRVKGVEIGGDATVVDVSISFANRITNTTMLALADTFLEDESGARLHIKRPENNRNISVREGETLDGQLVFMGSVPVSARTLKVVFNDGNQGDNIVAPGLTINLPLQDG
ncbi:hypothetical protein [Acidovorax sp. Root219]|uniref:hypothetical protein n=1 Tax=Acidovorax sp. Root219 TaxID=1736493 RepID=UPI00070F5D25|nr:hypothetical protein [Acidovorax sp. Root219]KRC21705.1 hypothetical protein ASE28_03445 [Acidovorax sp. Root219]